MGRRLRTFDGRVIFVDEVALDELDGQTTLTNTTTTDDYELVFPKELGSHGQSMSRCEGLGTGGRLQSHKAACQWL